MGRTIRSGLRAATIFAVACWPAAGCGGDIRADELNRSIASLQSSAGDGELLAFGVVEDRTRTTFVRVHARELTETTDHEAEKLQDASAGPELRDPKRRAVELATRISEALGDLQTAPEDRGAARAVRERLRDLADEAQSLRDEL